jgi:hypothetical protein
MGNTSSLGARLAEDFVQDRQDLKELSVFLSSRLQKVEVAGGTQSSRQLVSVLDQKFLQCAVGQEWPIVCLRHMWQWQWEGSARRLTCDVQAKKAAEEQRQRELAELFAVAIKQPKVPVGVDPKSIVCEYFRHGQCTKGFKCKFSHDLAVERKTAKIDLFSDR